MHVKKDDLRMLIGIFQREPKQNYYGICANYVGHVNDQFLRRLLINIMIDCCKELDIYSYDPGYPIDHPNGAEEAFYYTNDLWDISTKYGCDRVAVRDLMLDKLKERLNEN